METKSLRLAFSRPDESQMTITLPSPKSGLDKAAVRTAMETVVAQKAAFVQVPSGLLKAEVIARNVTDLLA